VTYNPATLQALGRYWTGQGGVNLGVVGDVDHQNKGTSYHLGADKLAPTAYSARTARDRAGLTNAASAIDLGKLEGTLANLRAFSTWLVGQARANAPGTYDMREIIYTPDGKVVLRWDRERGHASAPRPGEADASHLTHSHISWYRDAERRDHTTAFRPYFEEAPVRSFVILPGPPGEVIVQGPGHSYLDLADDKLYPIAAGAIKATPCPIRITPGLGDDSAGRSVGYLIGAGAAFLLAADVVFVATPAPAATYAVTVGGRPAGSVELP